MNNMMREFQQFVSDPAGYFARKGVDVSQGPQAIIQGMMDNGRLSQADYNKLQEQARQMQSFIRK